MQQLLFDMKRAHHGALRHTRKVFAQLGVTAARFDLLYAVRHGTDLWQAEIARILGIRGPTVSRTLRLLEERGIIRRRRCPWDKRMKLVTLTDEGRRLIVRAIRVFIHRGIAGLIVLELVGAKPERWWPIRDKPPDAMPLLEAFDEMLTRVRRQSKDFARLHYTWHPDD